VPLLPWLGVMWWGMAAGQRLLHHRPAWLQGPASPAGRSRRLLVTLGQWSLSYYLLHQPVLIGMLMAVVWLRGLSTGA
ncbi:MAG: DUF1624 domain-containing protein, partial [Burkholderiales bacterium]